ncbi:predicted protein [Brucella abortus bv. 3 str. Tulya]|nr:predicted protein [Brucella abortus bv. 3 str. Tulya]
MRYEGRQTISREIIRCRNDMRRWLLLYRGSWSPPRSYLKAIFLFAGLPVRKTG